MWFVLMLIVILCLSPSTGDFRNYTAYNVSLFAVFNNHSTFLKSAIAYTLEGGMTSPNVITAHNE